MKRFDMYDLRQFDPFGGVLVMTTYWRPRVKDPDPDHPGEKLSALSYLPTEAEASCPCGSGCAFVDCCQPLPYWRPVCPDPDLQGYSLLHAQTARFTPVDTQKVRAFLHDDERLYGVEETSQGAIWIYWGDPAYDTPPYGTICFGDLELQEPHTLVVSALSETRMKVLLGLLRPLNLDAPHIQLETPSTPPKQPRRTPRKRSRGA